MSYPNFPFDGQAPARQAEEKTRDDFIDLERLLHMALRQAKVVIVCAFIGLLVGVVYLQTTPPTYTSVARVLIDDELSKIVDEVSPLAVNTQSDATVLSEVEVLKSSRLAAAVVDRLQLHNNESFMNPPTSLLSRVIGYVRGLKDVILPRRPPPTSADPQAENENGESPDANPRRRHAIQSLQGSIRAERVGRSYVIAIAYKSHDPRLASTITNAYSEAYLDDQLNASFDASEQAAVWLQGRLTELRRSSQEAALEVERYRAEHGLTAARGHLVTEQQLSDLTTQLAEARADTARAEARYEQYRSIVEEDGSAAAIEEAISNAVVPADLPPGSNVGTLRERYLSIVRRQRQVETDFGADHPQALALDKEASNLAEQVFNELRQLTQNYRSAYEVAQTRESNLRESVAEASGEKAEANQSQVRLRELEQQAAALSSLYQSFLNRYETMAQQQSFPVTKARIISKAATPSQPTSPKTIMVLGLSAIMGMMMGAGLGALNEFNERFFRTGEDVTDRLGLRFFGYLPVIGQASKSKRRDRDKASNPAGAQEGTGIKPNTRAKMRVTLHAPSSMYSETLRSVKIASDVVLQKTPHKVIGVISALPGEGKSTVAANLAQLLASNNSRTLLIDGDLRNPALTRALGIEAEAGLVEAIVDAQSWRTMLKFDRQTKLAILPGVVRGQFSHTSEALSSAGMRRLLDDAKGIFEHIIVDLPPLGPIVDAKAFAPFADGLVVVVEWGRTPRALVRSLLASEPAISSKVLGVVLNKVRLEALPKYGSFGGSEQFLKEYSHYYIEKDGEAEPPAPYTPVRKKADAHAAQES